MFTAEESWKMSEPEMVTAIIKEIGIWRLGHCDGCMCCSFALRNVNIDVHCGKGQERAVRVYSSSGDYSDNHDEMLKPIAEEVQRQVKAADARGDAPIFYGPWRRDPSSFPPGFAVAWGKDGSMRAVIENRDKHDEPDGMKLIEEGPTKALS